MYVLGLHFKTLVKSLLLEEVNGRLATSFM